ncbi:helix-turn-helix domain-containing protein [Ralstonia insidiosa]|uniref:helix-turn-helix domain-containing protein n=1 Tax=Ralstonia insidiosa TaxID=190721 RepID=UPI000CEE2CE8|nr:helix-turn-helix domain-containing protein [Ralstonia insidiosa]
MKKVNSHLIELPNNLTGMNTGQRIRMVRTELGWTQEELGRRAGVSQGLIAQIENGTNQGSKHLVAIARSLAVSADWLETGKGERVRKQIDAPISLYYPHKIDDALTAMSTPDGEGLLLVFRDEHGSQLTLRLTDMAARSLAEKLVELGKRGK